VAARYEWPYEWKIGVRYLRSAHRSGFVSFVASMSVIGLALGVAVLIVVLSVLNGFERELRSRMLAVTSHATITGVDGYIANWREAQADAAREPDVVAVVPFVESRGLLANGERVAGVMVRGVLPEEEVKAVGLGARMRGGTFESLQAGKYQIWPKHAIERSAAHSSTVFTTVSEVTSYEAEKLLGRKPDVILPNGLNIQKFAALHEFQNLHRQYKERIHEFVMGHFFPSYTFDLDNTLYFFTSGRYEYTNKGIDLFVEAMWRLNQRMKSLPAHLPRATIVAFIITRAATRNVNVNTLQNQSMFEDLRNS